MKKKVLALAMCAFCLAAAVYSPAVYADGQKVVTLGADLSEEQKQAILRYFGVAGQNIQTLTITNQDERDHLGAYVPLEQIGTHTFSCALVNPTASGGIQVKTANLNWVTSNMIASTLSTSGVVNCEVLAAAPFEVSGTGALTGILMAYESAVGTVLDTEKKEIATQEMVTTTTIANNVGQVQATEIVNDTKMQVIQGSEVTQNDIDVIIDEAVEANHVSLSDEDRELLYELLAEIADQDYDYEEMKDTLERVQENMEELSDQIEGSGTIDPGEEELTDITLGEEEPEEAAAEEETPETLAADSILLATDDSALGEAVIFDATDSSALAETEAPEQTEASDALLDITASDSYSEEPAQAEDTDLSIPGAETAEPVAEIPVEGSEPVAENSAEVTEPVEEIPAEVTEPVEEIPAEETEPVEEIPAEVTEPVEEIPAEVTEPVEEIPAEAMEPVAETPVETEIPAEEPEESAELEPAQEIPAEDPAVQEIPDVAEEIPAEEIGAGEAEGQPVEPGEELGAEAQAEELSPEPELLLVSDLILAPQTSESTGYEVLPAGLNELTISYQREGIGAGSGMLTVYHAADSTIYETVNMNDTTRVAVEDLDGEELAQLGWASGKKAVISLPVPLAQSTDYFVGLSQDALSAADGSVTSEATADPYAWMIQTGPYGLSLSRTADGFLAGSAVSGELLMGADSGYAAIEGVDESMLTFDQTEFWESGKLSATFFAAGETSFQVVFYDSSEEDGWNVLDSITYTVEIQ